MALYLYNQNKKMNGTINALKQRSWKESQAHSSWQIFKIMANL